ncbi:heme lyase CcmF/NrfE family subunit [Sphingomicrobium sediminis]|uniref:Heme lyase CcmF/NrfE family subunit n=1 Tax=Sphingomicrobium sediminis TaxID=2950949 RepID=A0A9X2EF04_9SPHN|nr:heme lyase CcmF/NrfE family subunit [Sphingomicrobium sediminis]MCM8556713.1 heme lyase CcmF/NrfE family subunit [Sphingomicrobium sediminis]
MTAELGHALLWLAAALALVQLGLGIATLRGSDVLKATRAVAIVQALLVLGSFIALIRLFMVTDLSVLLVATHSHTEKPAFYKFAATWGNHEGSMLLWVLLLSLFGAMLAMFAKRLDPKTLGISLGTQAGIGLGFFAFLLFSSNPFARLNPSVVEGRGLNPVLQDPGLVYHPPLLYVGYVGLSVLFSLAVGAMLAGKVDAALGRAMRPWALLSWIFLTAGILGGSYWAYYELGWGGYWFWDPVENASLMPWLAATALLHSVSVLAAREALRAWTMMLALIGFTMSMLGTFLVRSGLITSVHAFAVDPERGVFILVLMALYVGLAFTIYGLKIAAVRAGEPFEPVSREGALVANNLLLSAILALVLIGTFYPVVAEAFGAAISVGPPYFNLVTAPLALLLAALLFIGPSLNWKKQSKPTSRAIHVAWLAAVAALIAPLLFGAEMTFFERLGLSLGVGLALGSLVPLMGRKLWRTPAPIWGMVTAHFGIALLFIGIASESAFTSERLALVRAGDEIEVAGWTVQVRDIRPALGPNWSAIEAQLVASRGSGAVEMLPQQRQFLSPPTMTSESDLVTRWNGQLYATLGQGNLQEGYQLRLWWKPMVTLIWLGAALIVLGGLISLIGRGVAAWRRRERNPEAKGYREARAW